MKPLLLARIVSVASLSVVFGGCLEIETTTAVREDGSLQRTVVIKGDSASIESGDYTIPLDTGWTKEVQKIDDKKFQLTATRLFSDVGELDEAVRGEAGKTLEARVSLEKSFLWFTTSYRYSEVYNDYNQFDVVPFSEFASEEELDAVIRVGVRKEAPPAGYDSLALEKIEQRLEAWNTRNNFESYYALFTEGVRRLNDPALTVESVNAPKETLFRDQIGQFFEDDGFYQEKNIALINGTLDRQFGKGKVGRAFATVKEELKEMERKYKFQEEVAINAYQVNVEMPGLITGTNARSLEGNKATWNEFMPYCYVKDYELWVESRVINWWSVILTGVVLLAGAVLFLVSALRRRSMRRVPV